MKAKSCSSTTGGKNTIKKVCTGCGAVITSSSLLTGLRERKCWCGSKFVEQQ